MATPQRSSTARRAQPSNVSPISSAAPAPSREKIAARAYEIWQEAGCPHGQNEAHWYQAERELKTRLSR